MLRWFRITVIFGLLTGTARAIPFSQPSLSPGEQCRTAIAAAERGHAIPPQLLSSIGRVESGKRDPGTGVWGAWPWTINAQGQGFYFDSKAEAIKAVEALQARGVRSIDVGCMQVNLMHHPTAFPNLDLAFEPAVNADYAARFLGQLHDQTGDWTTATADYHSSNPPEGGPYAAKVMAIWPEEQRRAGLTPPSGPAQTGPFGSGLFRSGLLARGVPPRPPPRMYAMAGMAPGKVPAGMMKGETAPAGIGNPMVAPPGMMQGGTIPAGTLPSGYMASRMAQAQAAQGAVPAGPSPGRGLDFYRATPIAMAMPGRIVRMANRITTR